MIRLRYLFFNLMMLFSAGVVVADQKPVDQDTSKVNLLNRMAFSLRESDPDMAKKYAEDALLQSEKIDYLKGKANALGNLGWISYRKTDFVGALKHSIEAIKLAEEIGDQAEEGRSRNNISAIYFEQKQYDKAQIELERALLLAQKLNDRKQEARTLNNLAYLFLMGTKNYELAEEKGRQALKVSEDIRDSYLTSFALRTLGDVAANRNNVNEAIAYYNRGIALSEKNKNFSMTTATYHRLAKVYLKQGRLEVAKTILSNNAEVAQRFGYKEELERTYKVLADLYFQMGDGDSAYQYLSRYTVLHDSIYSQQSSEQLALLQSQFELGLKEAEIALLTKDAALKQDEISKQRMQLYFTLLTSTSALLLVIILTYYYQRSKNTNRELNLQKEALARKNAEVEEKQLELTRLNATKDKLFSIIGHDFRSPLHSLKGLLTLIGNKNMSQQEFEMFSVDLRKKIDVIYDNLDNILNWSVTQLKGIQVNPSVIQPHQLTAEVFDLYDEMARLKNVRLINQISPDVFAHADKDQILLVLRNLISNALKFTSADGHVKLSADWDDRHIQIYVEDSGIGISENDMQKLFVKDSLWSVHGTQNEKGLGLGLLLCKEFIEKNNGTLTVTSEQGLGTTFKFTLPLVKGKGNSKKRVPIEGITVEA